MSSSWPAPRVAAGDTIWIFETVAHVIDVKPDDTFRAWRLLLRTDDARLHTLPVPLDYAPTPVPWPDVAREARSGAMLPEASRTG